MLTDAIALFGAGIASFLAPCVVPLVPAYLGMITGEAATRESQASVAAGRAVGATLLFVAGFAVVFAGLGVAAGLAGSSLRSVQDGLERGGGVLVALFGLALLGVLRGPFARERRLFVELPKVGGRLRPVVVGVAFGAAWSPCVGPLLGAALVAAARTGDPVEGAVLLFAYACGIGVPFVAASLGLASAPGLFDRLRRIGPGLERVAGGFLVVLGVLLATGWYAHLTSYLAESPRRSPASDRAR
jgi:cytochrome c-type biogenesis protein